MSNVERIAEGLTAAQREAILCWETDVSDKRLAALMAAITDPEVRQIREMGLATKPSLHLRRASILTPLGKSVRSYLQESGK